MRRKITIFSVILILAISISGQKKDHGTIAESGSVQDFSSAGSTMPIKSGTTLPATCTANKEFYNKTDRAAGSRLYRCNGSGNGWVALDGAGGSSNHALLTNLDFANSGHTGFASSTHAATHKSGQSDALATVTPTASGIPQARTSGNGGTLHPDWLPVMVGDTGSGGTKGVVPSPSIGDGSRCLKGDGTWGDCGSASLPLANKGELLTRDNTGFVALPPGNDNDFLVADSVEEKGLKWATVRTLVERIATPVDVDQGVGTVSDVSVPSTGGATKTWGGTAPHTLGFLTFDPLTAQTAIYQTAVPQGWDGTAVELLLRWTRTETGVNTPRVYFEVKVACVGDTSSVITPTYNAAQPLPLGGAGVTLPNPGTQKTTSLSSVDMTGCLERRTMFVQVTRDPNNAVDDFTGFAKVYQLMIRFYVKPQFGVIGGGEL